MHYYQYSPDMNRFDGVKATGRNDKALAAIKGQPLADTWAAVPVQHDPVTRGKWGDFPYLSGHATVPVLTPRAWEALQPLIGPCVEALPLRCKEKGELFALNVVRVEDCLDETKSVFARLSSNNRIYRVEKFAFRDGLTPGPIFCVPQVRNTVLVTDAFREAVERHGLKGLEWFPL